MGTRTVRDLTLPGTGGTPFRPSDSQTPVVRFDPQNVYGRQVRSTFVPDGERAIRREWRGVTVPGHAQEVTDFVKEL